MPCRIWKPGTDQDLDRLFDHLREQQYNNHQDPLWPNYSAEAFNDCAALSIFFDSDGVPEVCSSIAERSVWPAGAYRICNRFWKPNNRLKGFNSQLSEGFVETVRAQIEWLKNNTDSGLCFISRQKTGWQRHLSTKLNDRLGTCFRYDKYRYQTCPCSTDETCWQNIIYDGDTGLLNSWSKKS